MYIMRFSLLSLAIASVAATRFNYHDAPSKRVMPRSDGFWDHIVHGANVDAARQGKSQATDSKSQLADFRLRATAQDPSALGVDTVKQYSGYLDNDAEDKHLFYWFFESRNDPKTDPVVLWLNGGPGCSSFVGLFQELGPATITPNQTVVNNPYSWNSNASVIFIDQPVNVGFSYSNNNSTNSTLAASEDLYALLTLFFHEFPEYSTQDFHISGESYAGHYIPGIGYKIVTEEDSTINLKSLLIGNGLTDPLTQYAYYQPMACGGGGYPAVLDDDACATMEEALPKMQTLIQGCYDGDLATCKQGFGYGNTNFFSPYSATGSDVYDVRNEPDPKSGALDWLNTDKVMDTLGVEVSSYDECSTSVYNKFIQTGDWMKPIHLLVPEILAKIPVLVYAGDADYICNWLGNEAWTKKLEWPGKESFNAAEAQPVEAEGETYGNLTMAEGFAFLQVFQAGHMVPTDQPVGSLDMLNRWVRGELA